MKTLLYLEWIKLSRKASTWIFIAVYAILVPVIIYWFTKFTIHINEQQEISPSEFLDFTPDMIWMIVAYLASYLVWFFVLPVIMSTSDDLRFNIWRQHLIEGLGRMSLIFAKLMAVFFFAMMGTLVLMLTSIGMMYMMDAEIVIFSSKALTVIGSYFLYLTAFMVAGLVLCQFVKNSGITLLMLLLWTWIVEKLLRYFVDVDALDYLVTNSFNDLIINPVLDMADYPDFQLSHTEAVVSSLVWLVLMIGIGLYRIRKTDL